MSRSRPSWRWWLALVGLFPTLMIASALALKWADPQLGCVYAPQINFKWWIATAALFLVVEGFLLSTRADSRRRLTLWLVSAAAWTLGSINAILHAVRF
jgi:hypothetical protein